MELGSGLGGITSAEGREQFLSLLVTQLQQQDPLDPVKNQEFISQLTELSTLESIEKLNASFSDMLALQQLTSGANLIGKSISYINDDGNQEGVVAGLEMQDGRLHLKTTDEQLVQIDTVLSVVN